MDLACASTTLADATSIGRPGSPPGCILASRSLARPSFSSARVLNLRSALADSFLRRCTDRESSSALGRCEMPFWRESPRRAEGRAESLDGGRDRFRTCDSRRVKPVLYP